MFNETFSKLKTRIRSRADAIRISCELEATAPKLGNVHPAASFADCSYDDFVAAAGKIAPVLGSPYADYQLGQRVLDAVTVTKSVTKANVNLGIILLIAPLAMIDSSDQIPPMLDLLTPDDGRNVFEAIRLASPGGMKLKDVSADVDVESIAMGPIDLIAAMKHAAGRDRIALQYATGFADFFQEVVGTVDDAMSRSLPATVAVVDAQLRLMATSVDTLIARKCGDDLAAEAMYRAAKCLQHDSLSARNEFDAWLREDGNRRNPGTTADMIAASLYWLLRPSDAESIRT